MGVTGRVSIAGGGTDAADVGRGPKMEADERFLCLASCEKGQDFLRQCAEMGVKTTLLTLETSREGDWPRDALEDLATMPAGLTGEQILNTVSWMARGRRFDRIVALDEEDLETAALIREHMRLPGMGLTTAGSFRDKLAMRAMARAFNYRVPEFCRVLNYDELREFMHRVPAPWLLKARRGGSAETRRIDEPEQLWRALGELGDAQSRYLLEQFLAGEIFCVDSIVNNSEVKFATVYACGRALAPGFEQEAVQTTRTVDRASREATELIAIDSGLVPEMGMVRGITHAEFIRADADGRFYFVEIGANAGLADLVETATGVNLWREWARLEVGHLRREKYALPGSFEEYAGSILWPSQAAELDSAAMIDPIFNDPAIVKRVSNCRPMGKHLQAGVIVRAATAERVKELLDGYSALFEQQRLAAKPLAPAL